MLRLEAKGSPGKFHTILLVLELSPELEVASRESEASVAPGASAAYQHREGMPWIEINTSILTALVILGRYDGFIEVLSTISPAYEGLHQTVTP